VKGATCIRLLKVLAVVNCCSRRRSPVLQTPVWERLAVNFGIVLVFVAFCFTYLKAPECSHDTFPRILFQQNLGLSLVGLRHHAGPIPGHRTLRE
jgi:hypothetical protein